ncbi:hypothetical protein Goklo_026389, partial [Gossypium klotzschianum]|nr:hypothetical protein [Gossypium klotzschianum]
VQGTSFTIVNKCNYVVWPGVLSNAGVSTISTTGFTLRKGESKTISAPASWGGRFWGRTHCSLDSAGKFSCLTGDCGSGKLEWRNCTYTGCVVDLNDSCPSELKVMKREGGDGVACKSAVAAVRMGHRTLARRHRTRRCLRELAHAPTAMRMMIKAAHLHVAKLITPLLSALRRTPGKIF